MKVKVKTQDRTNQDSGNNHWYTPPLYLEAARDVMGGFDLDPASDSTANKSVRAKTYYSAEGLLKPWYGRVWLNPPYRDSSSGERSGQAVWSRKLVEEFEAGNVKEAIMLVHASTGDAWFQRLWGYLVCFTDHRIRFVDTQGNRSSPTKSNAIIYMGENGEKFVKVFGEMGAVVAAIKHTTRRVK